MIILARILSHGFAILVVAILAVGLIYRGELFPDMQLPGFLADASRSGTGTETSRDTTESAPAVEETRGQAGVQPLAEEEPSITAGVEATTTEPVTRQETGGIPPAEETARQGGEASPVAEEVVQQPSDEEVPATETTAEAPTSETAAGEAESAAAAAAETTGTGAEATATEPAAVQPMPPGATTGTAEEAAAETTGTGAEATATEPAAVQPMPPGATTGTAEEAAAETTGTGAEVTAAKTAAEQSMPPGATTGIAEEASTGVSKTAAPQQPVAEATGERPAASGETAVEGAAPAETPEIAVETTLTEITTDITVPSEPETAVPQDASTPYQLLAAAREAYWMHEYAQAEANYLRLAEQEPDNADSYGELGNMYFTRGQWEQAADAYFEAGKRLVAGGYIDEAQSLVNVIRGLNGSQADELAKLITAADASGKQQ